MIDTTNMSILANLIQSTNMVSNVTSKKDSDSSSSSTSAVADSTKLFSSYNLDSSDSLNKSELTTAIDAAISQFNGEMPSKEEFEAILSDFGFEVSNKTTSSTENSLSSSQLETISTVLENYDADNLSKSDAQEIIAAFKEAGIEPSSELESAMEEAGFDASEIGTLAGEAGAKGGGGGGGGGGSSSDEEYDVMDTNEDGTVSLEELQAYYGSSDEDDESTEEISSKQQSSLDNIQLLMDSLKSSSNDSIDLNSFNGLLKVINNQNNNSEINAYLQSSSTSTMFDYA